MPFCLGCVLWRHAGMKGGFASFRIGAAAEEHANSRIVHFCHLRKNSESKLRQRAVSMVIGNVLDSPAPSVAHVEP
eukprot:15463055-Alexandrium_andersonii.AAC.1